MIPRPPISDQPLVTILMCTYRRPELLKVAVGSLQRSDGGCVRPIRGEGNEVDVARVRTKVTQRRGTGEV